MCLICVFYLQLHTFCHDNEAQLILYLGDLGAAYSQ